MHTPTLRRTAVATVVGLLLGLAALVATPAPASAGTVQQDMLSQVNAVRAAHGLGPVALCANLSAAAQAYANLMAGTGWFNHTGPDGSNLATRAEASGYVGWLGIGENLAFGYTDVSGVMGGWLTSAGHAENILNPSYTHLGVGMAVGSQPYWSQMFGTAGQCGGWNPTGNLESVRAGSGTVAVGGWAVDGDTTGAINVHIYVDGAGVASLAANQLRGDVGAHGFSATLAVRPGGRQVCAYGINVGPGGNTLLGCRTVWVPDPASPFWDVLSTHPFFGDIAWLATSGIAGGYPDGSFRPTTPVTRQAMAAFLWRSQGSPSGPFPDPGFFDIGAGHPFETEIAWMSEAELTTGYKDGTFRGDVTVSRQATAAFLWRLEGEPAPPAGAPTFPDVPADSPFYDAIRWAAANGITTGYGDGTFRPGAPVSRQAMAAFLHRWLG